MDIEDMGMNHIKLPQTFMHMAVQPPESYCFTHQQVLGTNVTQTVQWFVPSSYTEMLTLMHQYPASKIVHGNTELGIEMKFKNSHYATFIYPCSIQILKSYTVTPHEIQIGGLMTIADLQKNLENQCDAYDHDHRCRGLKALLENIQWFAGNQVRNVASWSGNIVTASPISDLNPILMAMVTHLYSSYNNKNKYIPDS